MTTLVAIEMVRSAYSSLSVMQSETGEPLPVNRDRLRRPLDCAVIQHLHAIYEAEGRYFDSARGVFAEGAEIYPGSGFDAKTHVQIAVRRPDCIKGVFRVPGEHLRRWNIGRGA